MKITYGAVLPVPIGDAFAFVADPVNWPLFSPGVREVTKDDDWGRLGSHARLTSVVLGRPLTMQLELIEWHPPSAFRYTVSRDGGPGDDDNRRTFQPVTGGTRLTGTTEIPANPGWAGLGSRLQMLLVRAVFATAMARLPAAAVRHRNAWVTPDRPGPPNPARPAVHLAHALPVGRTRVSSADRSSTSGVHDPRRATSLSRSWQERT